MNASDADRQIKQMVNFILQEAQEKANEIRIKVRSLDSQRETNVTTRVCWILDPNVHEELQ